MIRSQDQVLVELRDLIEKQTGIFYVDSSLPMLADRLRVRVAILRLKDLLDYYYYLKWDPRREAEWEKLLQQLTVNETHFWRESDALTWAVEKLRQDRQPGRCLRVWHAACSSGEEPYSLAMGAMRAGLVPWQDFDLIASDLDPAALSSAVHAHYSPRALRHLPATLRTRYTVEGEKGSLVSPDVRAAVRFFRLNLHDATVAWPRDCELIFCRNVFIYFRPPTIQAVVDRLWESLRGGGHLILGAAESLLHLQTGFEFCSESDMIVYRKPKDPA